MTCNMSSMRMATNSFGVLSSSKISPFASKEIRNVDEDPSGVSVTQSQKS